MTNYRQGQFIGVADSPEHQLHKAVFAWTQADDAGEYTQTLADFRELATEHPEAAGAIASAFPWADDGERAAFYAGAKLDEQRWDKQPGSPAQTHEQRQQAKREKVYQFPLAHGSLPDLAKLKKVPPRDWTIYQVLLAGKAALLAGFGGVAKTALHIQWGVHVALGRDFDGRRVPEGIAILVLGEEDEDERNRRIGAVLADMKLEPAEVQKVRERLIVFPAQGMDMRLVQRVGQAVEATGLGDNLITLAQERAAALKLPVRMISLDHYAMLTDGDFSDGGAATILTTEAGRLARVTGAAVLVVCHMPKAAAGKQDQDQHSVFGSAFNVNNTRTTLLLVGMTPKEAKVHGGMSDEQRKRYVQLQIGKANAGPSDERVCWLERRVLPEYETIVLRPVSLQAAIEAKGLTEKNTWAGIVQFLKDQAAAGVFYSKKELEDARGRILPAGSKSLSRDAVRDALKALEGLGVLNAEAELPAAKRRGTGPQAYVKVVRDLAEALK